MANNVSLHDGVHGYTDAKQYIPPDEPGVLQHIDWFMGLKLGLMMHWSPGSQLGTYESWPLCDCEKDWSQKDVTWTDDIEEFKQQYINANRTFNPVKFRPDKWAELADDCGFKYLLFTTKHHDGFCMFDTKTTDYKITAPSCPFHTHRNADIVRSLYDAFRQKGLAISVYFSKPDWSSPFYWSPEFGSPPDRNTNYSVADYPELWEQFVQYTHEQIRELTTDYGKVDVLWLDGGWVRPDNFGQDIRLDKLISEIRSTSQPHLIVCDRTVGGRCENIITPEQTTPPAPLPVPWESCVSLGKYFSYHYDDEYKSVRQVIHMLLDIVSKGGNLALNVTPQPDGELPARAVHTLKGLGLWMKKHGEGIYETRICPPYRTETENGDTVVFTRKDNEIFAFILYREDSAVPQTIRLQIDGIVSGATLLGDGSLLSFYQQGDQTVLDMSAAGLEKNLYADGIRLTVKK